MTEPGPGPNFPTPHFLWCPWGSRDQAHEIPVCFHVVKCYFKTFRRAPEQWALAGCLQPDSLFSGTCGFCALAGHLSVPRRARHYWLLTAPKPHGGVKGGLRPQLPEPLCRGTLLNCEKIRRTGKCGGKVWVLWRHTASFYHLLAMGLELVTCPWKKSSVSSSVKSTTSLLHRVVVRVSEEIHTHQKTWPTVYK